MAGRPGRSGGWNKLSPEEHARRGTKPRKPPSWASYAAALRQAAPESTIAAAATPPPPDVTEGLSGRGLRWVQAVWAQFGGWSHTDLLRLAEVGRLVEAIDAERASGKHAYQARQQLIALLRDLNLPPGAGAS